jgi:hypothetical protein
VDELHVGGARRRRLAPGERQHGQRDLDRDHAAAVTDVYQGRFRPQTVSPQRLDVLGGIDPGLGVIALDIAGIKMLRPGMRHLIEHPPRVHATIVPDTAGTQNIGSAIVQPVDHG